MGSRHGRCGYNGPGLLIVPHVDCVPFVEFGGAIVSEIVLSVPEQALAALKLTPQQAAPELLLAAAVKLYEIGRLSSGAAARLAGIPRPLFLAKLSEYGVATFRLTAEESKQETPLA